MLLHVMMGLLQKFRVSPEVDHRRGDTDSDHSAPALAIYRDVTTSHRGIVTCLRRRFDQRPALVDFTASGPGQVVRS